VPAAESSSLCNWPQRSFYKEVKRESMRVTTKGRYALRAVLKLATIDSGKPVSIRQLVEGEDISPEFLEQIFFKLKKSGIISSTRGPGGGFQLTKKPSEVSLKEILESAGEDLWLAPCTSFAPDTLGCEKIDDCQAHDIWETANNNLLTFLRELTLEDMLQKNIS